MRPEDTVRQSRRTCTVAPRRSRGRLLALLVLPYLGALTGAQEGGIEVFAAETLFASGTRASLSHVYETRSTLFRGSSEIPDPLDRELDEHRIVAGIDHGLRPDLTVSVLIPWVAKDLGTNVGDTDGAGLGDVALLGKYRVFKRDWPRSAYHVSVIGGLELPTGTTSERDGGGRLPPGLQPGSGAWNPFVALSTNLNLDRYRFDAQAFYKLNSEGAQDFEKGDFLALSADAAYRFLHTKYPGPTASAKLGLQWRRQARAEQFGARLADSGSDELRGRAGFTWHPAPNIDISIAVEVPLQEDLDGDQLGLDYRTFAGIGVRF